MGRTSIHPGKLAPIRRVPSMHRMRRPCRIVVQIALGIALPAVSHAQASEDEFFYVIDTRPYDTLDEACHAGYDAMSESLRKHYQAIPDLEVIVRPYKAPERWSGSGDTPTYFDCRTYYDVVHADFTDNDYESTFIQQKRRRCPAGQQLDFMSDTCKRPADHQLRKELGDPGLPLLGGPSLCVGNPISASTGNKYQEEEDYRDADGELQLVRHYNGLSGLWQVNYGKALYIDPYGRGLTLFHGDGRQSQFALNHGSATAETTEQGSLEKVDDHWIYTAPNLEQYSFDAQGALTAWRLADGRVQTLAYRAMGPGALTIVVTDSSGHGLQLLVANGLLARAKTGKLTVTYGYDRAARLTKVTRTWPGHARSRSYLYEDTAHPGALTGIVDERGVRYATWRYDASGRAISSEHAGGADKTTLSFNDDGSTTVTNALGNAITYRYRVIQGVKRVTAIEGEPAPGCPASNTTYTYTELEQVATRTDALGTVTAYDYDAKGREIRRVEAKGTALERTTATTWDATRHLPLTVTTADRVITYTYDDQGRPLSTSVRATEE